VLSQLFPGTGALFEQMAIIARAWPDPDPAQTESVFRALIENTIAGASSIPQALQSAEQQLNQIISPQS
jgi:hypothetical protein